MTRIWKVEIGHYDSRYLAGSTLKGILARAERFRASVAKNFEDPDAEITSIVLVAEA